MITNDQIEKAAAAYVNDEDGNNPHSFIQYPAFYEGAKWARDQQPKLKTLEWLYSKTSYGGFASAATPFLTYEVINDGTYYSWGIAGYAKRQCESIDHGKQTRPSRLRTKDKRTFIYETHPLRHQIQPGALLYDRPLHRIRHRGGLRVLTWKRNGMI